MILCLLYLHSRDQKAGQPNHEKMETENVHFTGERGQRPRLILRNKIDFGGKKARYSFWYMGNSDNFRRKKNYWGFLKNWEETKNFFVSNKMGDFLIESYVDANSYEEKAPNERVYELTD